MLYHNIKPHLKAIPFMAYLILGGKRESMGMKAIVLYCLFTQLECSEWEEARLSIPLF